MSEITIYHNPNCTKSRKTLEMLRSAGHEPIVIEYLKMPPSAGDVKQIAEVLIDPISDLVRTKEPEYTDSPFDTANVDQIATKIAEFPKLLERPIVICNNQAVICRPPEKVEKVVK